MRASEAQRSGVYYTRSKGPKADLLTKAFGHEAFKRCKAGVGIQG
jgi:hypothetical protein